MARVYSKKALAGAFFAFHMLLAGLPSQAEEQCQTPHIDERATVAHVVDGDTLRLSNGRKVRLIGINAPEIAPAQPFGSASQLALQDLLGPGTPVLLRYGIEQFDRYQRTLAHVFLEDGTNIQAWLLERGFAATIAVPPNLWGQDCYWDAEQKARRRRRGMWSAERFQAVPSAQLEPKSRGFYIVRGEVTAVASGAEGVELNLAGPLKVHIDRADLKHFQGMPLSMLKNRLVEVRGWLYPYRSGLRMRVHHASSLKRLK